MEEFVKTTELSYNVDETNITSFYNSSVEDGNKSDKNVSYDHFEGLYVKENSSEDQSESAYSKVKMRSKAEGERFNSNICTYFIFKRNNDFNT